MFLYRWMRPLLEAGHVWMVRAPVGELRLPAPEGTVLAYTPPQFQALADRARALGEGQATLLRYRGLAGLDRSLLQEACLDPASRVAHAMQVRDAEMAIEVFGRGAD
jgi:DNA gyrase subunit B